MSLPHLHVFPVAAALLLPITFVLTYVLAVSLGHVELDWPYISDTSAQPPESCIFAQLVNLAAILLAIVVYIRYKQVEEFYVSHEVDNRSFQLNTLSLYLGFLVALGASMTANFQETAVSAVHFTGALMAFGLGTIYLWTQTYASFILCGLTHSKTIRDLRLALSSISSVAFFVTVITGYMAKARFHGEDHRKWYPADGGWGWHVVSTVTEWIIALIFNIYTATFAQEFKLVQLESPKIIMRINRHEQLFSVADSSSMRVDSEILS